MKLKVVHGGKEKKEKHPKKKKAEAKKPELGPFYPRGPFHAENMEKAEGDEDIIDEALRRQSESEDAA